MSYLRTDEIIRAHRETCRRVIDVVADLHRVIAERRALSRICRQGAVSPDEADFSRSPKATPESP